MRRLFLIFVVLLLSGVGSAGSMFKMGNIIGIMGYTDGDLTMFQELYDQDIAQGWGVVTKQGDNQFYVDCSLWLISG
jgi:hypothetical protein